MKTARELAHKAMGDMCGDRYERFGHTKECDTLAATIEARDAEWAERERVAFSSEHERAEAAVAALTVAREALEAVRNRAAGYADAEITMSSYAAASLAALARNALAALTEVTR